MHTSSWSPFMNTQKKQQKPDLFPQQVNIEGLGIFPQYKITGHYPRNKKTTKLQKQQNCLSKNVEYLKI